MNTAKTPAPTVAHRAHSVAVAIALSLSLSLSLSAVAACARKALASYPLSKQYTSALRLARSSGSASCSQPTREQFHRRLSLGASYA
jgi:hypothetical protein